MSAVQGAKHKAIMSTVVKVISLLAEKGCDVNAVDKVCYV